MKNLTKINNILIFLFFVSLIILSGCISSYSAPMQTQQDLRQRFLDWWGRWGWAINVGIALVISITSLTWMYASLMQKEDLKVWVKSELSNLVYSAIIIIFVFTLIDLAAYLVTVLSPYTPILNEDIGKEWNKFVIITCQNQPPDNYKPCHIKIAQEYLQRLSYDSEKQINTIIRLYSFYSFVASLGVGIKGIIAPGDTFGVSPFMFLVPITELLNFLYDILLKNLMVIKAQQIILDLVHYAFFPYLLAFGVFFRLFHFTRKVGGAMIALAISFYIVFPLLYVFWGSILYSFTGPWEININSIAQTKLYSEVNYGIPSLPLYDPDPNSLDYNPNCKNGKIEDGEECNEYEIITSNNPEKKQEIKILSCPPKDSSGNIIPGREKDIYCNWNNCKCINYSIDLDFKPREQLSKQNEKLELSLKSKLYADICYEKAKQDPKDAINLIGKMTMDFLKTVGQGIIEMTQGIVATGLMGENGLIHNVAKQFIFSIIAPFISLMASLASFKVMSELLGGDVYLAGLTRLI